MKEIYLIIYNNDFIDKINISKKSDIKLNNFGIKQSKLIGKYFKQKNKQINNIISLNTKITCNIANIIADEINFIDEIIKLDMDNDLFLNHINNNDKIIVITNEQITCNIVNKLCNKKNFIIDSYIYKIVYDNNKYTLK